MRDDGWVFKNYLCSLITNWDLIIKEFPFTNIFKRGQLSLMQIAYTHLNCNSCMVRIRFSDFLLYLTCFSCWYWERSYQKCQQTRPSSHGLLITWQTGCMQYVRLGGALSDLVKCRRSTGACTVFLPVNVVHLRLSVQLRVIPPTEILWWFCSSWMLKWWAGGGVQTAGGWFCGVVWKKSFASKCEKDQRDGDRLQKEKDSYTACV